MAINSIKSTTIEAGINDGKRHAWININNLGYDGLKFLKSRRHPKLCQRRIPNKCSS